MHYTEIDNSKLKIMSNQIATAVNHLAGRNFTIACLAKDFRA